MKKIGSEGTVKDLALRRNLDVFELNIEPTCLRCIASYFGGAIAPPQRSVKGYCATRRANEVLWRRRCVASGGAFAKFSAGRYGAPMKARKVQR
jgi:hypothetical protein